MNYSERALSKIVGLSRSTLRKALAKDESVKLSTFKHIANFYNQQTQLIAYPKDHTPLSSTVAISFKISADGFESWKIHLMNFVDEFRSSGDERLIILPPHPQCDPKIFAIISATTLELCEELNLQAPDWAINTKPLPKPWFVSGMESLKASALLESPMNYRSKNIFVHSNFLQRA